VSLQQKAGRLLAVLALYISFSGLITFSLFILEESYQTAMFGTWAAADAKDWQTVKTSVELMENINRTLKIVNYSAGWVQPLAFLSYRAYGRAADSFIASTRAKIFANAPELFEGETVSLRFTPSTKEHDPTSGIYTYSSGRIKLTTKADLNPGVPQHVRAMVSVVGKTVVLTTTN